MEAALLPEKTSKEAIPQQTRADFLKGCWVLFIFSFSAAMQSLLWILPGTLSTTLGSIYSSSFGPNTVQDMFIVGSFAFFPATFAAEYAMERFGLRICTITNVFMIACIAALRFAAQSDSHLSLALWILSAIFVGFTGPITMALPGYLAEQWFTPEQRATATAIAVESASLGSAFAYLLPGLVPQNTMSDLNRVYGLCMGLCIALLLCCVYFPAGPSKPPSRSAAMDVDDGQARAPVTLSSIWRGVQALARNSQFIIIVLVYGVILGFNGAWSTTLNLNLRHAGLSEDFAGYIGFSGMVSGRTRTSSGFVFCRGCN